MAPRHRKGPSKCRVRCSIKRGLTCRRAADEEGMQPLSNVRPASQQHNLKKFHCPDFEAWHSTTATTDTGFAFAVPVLLPPSCLHRKYNEPSSSSICW